MRNTAGYKKSVIENLSSPIPKNCHFTEAGYAALCYLNTYNTCTFQLHSKVVPFTKYYHRILIYIGFSKYIRTPFHAYSRTKNVFY